MLVSANSIEYRRGDITECYVNDEQGLQQRFTIAPPPFSRASGELVLELALSGGLVPRLTADGTAVEFTSRDGVTVLRYGDLSATDAVGRQIPVQIALSPTSLSLSLSPSLYPITVQGLITSPSSAAGVTPDGLSPSPDWSVEGDQIGAFWGASVSTAGDVDGDGHSDVIVGAPYYDNGNVDVGLALVYYGSASGLSTTPEWTVDGGQLECHFGASVGTAGDVNGDGYADVVVGAPGYTNGESGEGWAASYHGSSGGLATAPDWAAEGDKVDTQFGYSVSTAGDVDGDGYADVVVGADRYDEIGQTNEGWAFLYYGNGGAGLTARPRQMRTTGAGPIAPLGMSDSPTAVQLRLVGRMPLGRQQVKLHWQVAPLGTPFTATGVISGTSPTWTDTLTTGVTIAQQVGGLTPNTPYHWCVRTLYQPGNALGQPAGRWVHIPWNGWSEQDLRTPQAIAGLAATNDSPTPLGSPSTLTATVTAGNPVDYAWAFGDGQYGSGAVVTHTYLAAGIYTAIVTASNAVNELSTSTVVTVTAAQDIVVDPPALGAILNPGGTTSRTLTIGNAGDTDMAWSLAESPAVGWLAESSASGTVPPAGSSEVQVTFDAGGLGVGTYDTVLKITSDDSDSPLVSVTATLEVTTSCIPAQIVHWEWTSLSPGAGQLATFSGFADGTPPVTYSWDFGDEITGTGALVTHSYAATGTYTVTLSVANACGGDEETGMLTVVVPSQWKVYLPLVVRSS